MILSPVPGEPSAERGVRDLRNLHCLDENACRLSHDPNHEEYYSVRNMTIRVDLQTSFVCPAPRMRQWMQTRHGNPAMVPETADATESARQRVRPSTSPHVGVMCLHKRKSRETRVPPSVPPCSIR